MLPIALILLFFAAQGDAGVMFERDFSSLEGMVRPQEEPFRLNPHLPRALGEVGMDGPEKRILVSKVHLAANRFSEGGRNIHIGKRAAVEIVAPLFVSKDRATHIFKETALTSREPV